MHERRQKRSKTAQKPLGSPYPDGAGGEEHDRGGDEEHDRPEDHGEHGRDDEQKRSKTAQKKPSQPRSRGPWGYSIPEAGAMIGLGRDASYQAAKKGQIPTVDMGHLKIVPRIPWLRILGAEGKSEM